VNNMNKLTYRLSTGLATAALLTAAMMPLASADVTVQGNGANSDNTVVITNSNTTSVTQSNSSSVVNSVDANSNTGGNTANGNTGGDTSVQTGAASTTVTIKNKGNVNNAALGCCDCGCGCTAAGDVLIKNNGAKSNNTVTLAGGKTALKSQTNSSSAVNGVNAKAKTGKNKAKNNTGGTTNVGTGPAATGVGITNTGNTNNLVEACCTPNVLPE
jgi:hypothetical protein